MNQGIIDIGSNTIRLNVYKIEEKKFALLFSKKESVGLVSYVKKRVMTEEGIEILANCLNSFIEMMHSLNIHSFSAFATASLRNIDNTLDVIEKIKKRCHVSIDLLSGAQEGRISFIGAIHGLRSQQGMYVDTGGASSEIILYENREIGYVTSLPVGSLNLFNKYVDRILPTKDEYAQMKEAVLKELKETGKDRNFFRCKTMAIAGGSMRAIRSVFVALRWMTSDEYEISEKLLNSLEEYLFENRVRTAHLLLKVKPDRVHTLLCGLAIIQTLLHYTKAQVIQVSANGVREGYLIDKVIGGKYGRQEI